MHTVRAQQSLESSDHKPVEYPPFLVTQFANRITQPLFLLVTCAGISSAESVLSLWNICRCTTYYSSGHPEHGIANDEEKRLTMILFTRLFDALAQRVRIYNVFNSIMSSNPSYQAVKVSCLAQTVIHHQVRKLLVFSGLHWK